MSLKTFFAKVFGDVAHFFGNIFNAMELAWKHVSPAVQDALKLGAGVVNFINQHLNDDPAALKVLILDAFPSLTEEDLTLMMAQVSKELNLVEDAASGDLEHLIAAVQDYLKSRTGAGWANASDTIAKIIAIFKAPPETKASVIIQFMVFVYQTFIKKG